MIKNKKDLEIAHLDLLLKKKQAAFKISMETAAYYKAALAYETQERLKLEHKYDKLNDRFEANFKFHEYIKDVLDQTADLMENYDAVREQEPPVQKRVQAAGRKRRTREPHGAPASA
jgi:hypothetical protein